MLYVIIVVVVLVALVGFVIVGFNKLRTTDIGAQEALGGIDVQLTRRADGAVELRSFMEIRRDKFSKTRLLDVARPYLFFWYPPCHCPTMDRGYSRQ